MGSPAFTTYPPSLARQQHLTSDPPSRIADRSIVSISDGNRDFRAHSRKSITIDCRYIGCLLGSIAACRTPPRTIYLPGRQLRALREQTGKSQDTLANDSGLHRTYRRGTEPPPTLSRYAAGLGPDGGRPPRRLLMKTGDLRTAKLIRTQIRNLQPSIYDPPATELTGLFYSPPELQALLRDELIGRDNLD